MVWTLLGVSILGAALDAWSNAIATPVWLVLSLTGLILLIWLAHEVAPRFKARYQTLDGQDSRLTGLGPMKRTMFAAALLLLLSSLLVPRSSAPSDHPPLSTSAHFDALGSEEVLAIATAQLRQVCPGILEVLVDTAGQPLEIYSAMYQRRATGSECVAVVADPADSEAPMKTMVWKDRTNANLDPFTDTLEPAGSCRYEALTPDGDSAIVLWDQQGSGGFLVVQVYAWSSGHYRNLTQALDEDLYYAWFTFADLDEDGFKELIITHGKWAYDKEYLFYALRRTDYTYRPVSSKDPRYPLFEATIEVLKDKDVLDWGDQLPP